MPLSPLNQNQGFPVGKNHLDEILAKNRRVVHYLISQVSAVFEPGRSFLACNASIWQIKGNQPCQARNLNGNLACKASIWQIQINQIRQISKLQRNTRTVEIVVSQTQVLEILKTKKATWFVKSTRDGFVVQVETNNMSPIAAVYTCPRTTIRSLSFIPVHQFCGQSTVEFEAVLQFDQQVTLARHHKDTEVEKKWTYGYEEKPWKEWNSHWGL